MKIIFILYFTFSIIIIKIKIYNCLKRFFYKNMEAPICGGYSQAQSPDEDIKSLVAQVKHEAETKLGKTFNVFEAVSYTYQVVCGMNYSVKVKVGENEYIHVTIFRALPCYGGNVELTEVQGGKTLADAL